MTEVEDYKREAERHIGTIAQLRHQIECLQAELEVCKRIINALQTPDSEATAEIKKLREELRASEIIARVTPAERSGC